MCFHLIHGSWAMTSMYYSVGQGVFLPITAATSMTRAARGQGGLASMAGAFHYHHLEEVFIVFKK